MKRRPQPCDSNDPPASLENVIGETRRAILMLPNFIHLRNHDIRKSPVRRASQEGGSNVRPRLISKLCDVSDQKDGSQCGAWKETTFFAGGNAFFLSASPHKAPAPGPQIATRRLRRLHN